MKQGNVSPEVQSTCPWGGFLDVGTAVAYGCIFEVNDTEFTGVSIPTSRDVLVSRDSI